jgi:hypothetical protein
VTARFGPRFGAESALIIAAAVVAYLLELSWPAVAAVVFGAWLAIAVFEIVAARGRATETAPSSPGADVDAEAEAEARFEPAESLPPIPPPAPSPAAVLPAAGMSTVAEPPAAQDTPPPPPAPAPQPAPAPVFEAPVLERPSAGTPAPSRPPPRADGGRWNLWELERLARDQAGRDAVRDEERSFLLMYLREFADAEGHLPPEFDGLVRDSFGDLVAPAR